MAHLLHLRIDAVDGAQPGPGERLGILEGDWGGLLVGGVFVYWADDEGKPTVCLTVQN